MNRQQRTATIAAIPHPFFLKLSDFSRRTTQMGSRMLAMIKHTHDIAASMQIVSPSHTY